MIFLDISRYLLKYIYILKGLEKVKKVYITTFDISMLSIFLSFQNDHSDHKQNIWGYKQTKGLNLEINLYDFSNEN